MSNDFVLSGIGKKVELLSSDINDWRITFVDTGLHSNLGQRLLRVRKYLDGEEMFLANYSDDLSDLPLDGYVDEFHRRDAIASCVAVRPATSFHAVKCDTQGIVTSLEPVSEADSWVNGGYFCLRRQVFDYVREGEELVVEPFRRLITERRLWAHKHYGYWAAMDTFKDKINFDRMEARGDCPWMVWKR
jgi:glucose-1-phosphate cytidylyltransferase